MLDARNKKNFSLSSIIWLLTSNFLLLASGILLLFTFANKAYASQADYHPVTGEPDCMACHTPDRQYAIDYMREESCGECHGPFLSERYTAIDIRYKTEARDEKQEARGEIQEARNEKPEARGQKQETGSKMQEIRDIPKDMVLIPAGEFTMGSNDWWPKSGPEHKKNINTFYIDKYEVTNKKYKVFVDAAGSNPPDHWENNKIPNGKVNHPVVYVSYFDAEAYCRWEGKRLPTEAEWEKAARGADKRTFPWGDKFSKDKANTPQYGKEDTMPVGSFENGKSPYGVYDMAGNVWEWTADWFKPYPMNTHPDENYGEKYRVVRGGSWYDCTYYRCGISAPSYNRIFFNPNTRNNNFGFRCAK